MEGCEKKANNYYNSWDHVLEERARILTEDYPVLNELERTWRVIEKRGLSPLRDEQVASTPLAALNYYIDVGCYPPPEILLAVFNCFEYYMNNGGALELEDVFFNDKKKRIRNHAHFKAKESAYVHFQFTEQMSRFKNSNRSLYSLAEEMLVRLEVYDNDVDSFLRGYRRWKSRENEGS